MDALFDETEQLLAESIAAQVQAAIPATVSGPLWVSAPFVVTPKVPETVEAPRIKAFASMY